MGMIIKGITTLIIEMIDQSEGDGAKHPDAEGRDKIAACGGIGDPRADQIRKNVDQDDYNRGYVEISWLHGVMLIPGPGIDKHDASLSRGLWHVSSPIDGCAIRP